MLDTIQKVFKLNQELHILESQIKMTDSTLFDPPPPSLHYFKVTHPGKKLIYLISKFGFDIQVPAVALFAFLISIRMQILQSDLIFVYFKLIMEFFSVLPGCCFHLRGDIGCLCGAQKAAEAEFTSNVPLGFT